MNAEDFKALEGKTIKRVEVDAYGAKDQLICGLTLVFDDGLFGIEITGDDTLDRQSYIHVEEIII